MVLHVLICYHASGILGEFFGTQWDHMMVGLPRT
jgi:hypothetical protein